MICAWCLNLANNASLPAIVEWQAESESGTAHAQKSVVGAESMAHEIRAHHRTVGFKIRAYQLEITDPMAVTMIEGTALCGVHAGEGGWPVGRQAATPYPPRRGTFGR